MIAEGIRMKIAVVFVLLIAMVVLGLPFSVSGDATLTGAVQSFMTYGLASTGLLLGMLTIFLSRSISDDMTGHQIYLVATKPIARWEYVVGKWLGITLLNAVFLAGAGLAVYGMVHYIKRTHPPIEPRFDAAELENEVLVARHSGKMTIPDFSEDAELEFQNNLEGGMYADRPNFDPAEEKRRLAAKYEARWRVVGPQNNRTFNFENILVDRSPKNSIQLRYKTEVSQYPPDEIFRAAWQFGDQFKGTPVYQAPVRHMVGRYHTIRTPADAVAEDHTLKVRFFNTNLFPDEPTFPNVIEFRASDPVEVLFTVGSFEGNLFRLVTIMFCKLMFLAAVSVLAVTVFSFPVACLVSFTIYVLAGMRGFLLDALDLASEDQAGMFASVKEFVVQSVFMVFKAIYWVVPDFSRYDAIEDLVSGRNVSLVWVLQAVTELAMIKTLIVLGLAILLFHRRG
jgi:hypothetical protein